MPTTHDDFREDRDPYDGGGYPQIDEKQAREPDLFRFLHESRKSLEEQDLQAPDQIPDLRRELVMLDGALTSVEKRTAELAARLTPVLTDSDSLVKMTSAARSERPKEMRPASDLALRVSGFQERLGQLETFIDVMTNRLGV